jgi:hypothetical protein
MVESLERRRLQRVRLPQPIHATVDGQRAMVVDVSLQGLRLVHPDPIAGKTCVVRTEWDGHTLAFQCTVVRTLQHRSAAFGGRMLHHSGLSITGAESESRIALRHLIAHHVERALDEQKANARGVPPKLAAQSMATGGVPAAYVRHEYALGRWREVMTPNAAQPDNGFTIAAHTAPYEVDMLRTAYERAKTPADHVVIRKLAAMSVSGAEIVQARRYMP